jgi:hypothetical protein
MEAMRDRIINLIVLLSAAWFLADFARTNRASQLILGLCGIAMFILLVVLRRSKRRRAIMLLRWYEKDPKDALVGDMVLEVKLRDLRKWFDLADSDDMIECYPVNSTQARLLSGAAKVKIDLDKYDYFVECQANAHD